MTAVQLNAMNAQMFHDLGVIAEDENALKRAARYLRKLAKEMTEDSTSMSEEEFYAMLDKREEAYARGEYTEMLPGENLTEHLRRLGYDI